MSSGRQVQVAIVVRQVIRGERPWADLRDVGIDVDLEGDVCTIQNLRSICVSADVCDLACGLLRLRSEPADLQTWAFLLESESFVDWGESEHHPAWDPLWDAIWHACFGGRISAEALEWAKELAGFSPGSDIR